VVVAARTVSNLDLAHTVVVLDRRGRLRHAGAPGGPLAHLATLDAPTDEPDGARHDPPVRLPPMRPRTAAAHAADGLAAMLRLHAVLLRRRGNSILIGLAALAVVGAVAAAVAGSVPVLA